LFWEESYSKTRELLMTIPFSYTPLSVDFDLASQYLAVSIDTTGNPTYVFKVREYISPEPVVTIEQ